MVILLLARIIDPIGALADDGGQDLIEYALLAGAISLLAVATVFSVGSGVNQLWAGIESQVNAILSP